MLIVIIIIQIGSITYHQYDRNNNNHNLNHNLNHQSKYDKAGERSRTDWVEIIFVVVVEVRDMSEMSKLQQHPQYK